jgi:hypothetical protein
VNRRTAVVLALVTLVAVGVVAGVTRPSTPGAAAIVRAATEGQAVRTTLFCPDLITEPGTLGTQVVVGNPSAATGSVGVTAATSSTGGVQLPVRQHTATYSGPQTGPITLSAKGPIAAGLVGEQLSRGNKTADRGWAEARCETPRSDQWFVGAGTTAGDTPVVVLANPADTRAIATVTVLTPTGLIAAPVGGNLVLAPHAVQRINLTTLAPGVAVTAVHITTQTGEVSAAVRDIRVQGTTLLGTDWVPLGEPSSDLTVAGVPGVVIGQQPRRLLYLGVPGGADATVRVTVTTSSGTFVPVGLDSLAVGAETIATVDLGKVLGGRPAALHITTEAGVDGAPVPVVAGVLVDAASSKGKPIHEITFLGPAQSITGPALVPQVRTGPDQDSRILFSAPAGTVSGTLTIQPPTGPPRQVPFGVAGGTTVDTSARAYGMPDKSSVTVTPAGGSAPLYVVRLIEEDGALGPLLSAYEVSSAPATEPVPGVARLPLGQV